METKTNSSRVVRVLKMAVCAWLAFSLVSLLVTVYLAVVDWGRMFGADASGGLAFAMMMVTGVLEISAQCVCLKFLLTAGRGDVSLRNLDTKLLKWSAALLLAGAFFVLLYDVLFYRPMGPLPVLGGADLPMLLGLSAAAATEVLGRLALGIGFYFCAIVLQRGAELQQQADETL